MIIGISQIGTFIPSGCQSNFDLMGKFEVEEPFVKEKIGVESRTHRGEESNLDMALKAIAQLNFDPAQLDLICLVSQNPDYKIPHTSAIIHNKLGAGAEARAKDGSGFECPNCGSTDATSSPPGSVPSLYTVRCPRCGIFGWDTRLRKAVPHHGG